MNVIPFPMTQSQIVAQALTVRATWKREHGQSVSDVQERSARLVAFMALDKRRSAGYAIRAGYRVLGDDNLDPDNPDVTSDDDTFDPPVSRPLSAQVLTF
jgi:hypothetical protein